MMFECHVETYIDWTGFDKFDFQFIEFLSNPLLQIIVYCVTDQLSMIRSRRSALIFKFSVLIFLNSMSYSMSIEQNVSEEEIFKLQSMSNLIICNDRRFAVKTT